MLTGEVAYHHADKDFHLKPADALLFDSGALHGPERLIETPMTYPSIIVYPQANTRISGASIFRLIDMHPRK